MIKCDFCYYPLEATRAHRIQAPPMITLFPENDIGILGHVSADAWAACDICYSRLCAKKYDVIAREVLIDCLGDELIEAIRSGEYLTLFNLLVSQYRCMSPAC